MMREFVRSQNFTSTDEVMTAMKDMFKDILQEVMECELADEFGYEKSERTSNDECVKKSKSYRSGFSKRTNPALHHSSDTLKHKVCQLQTHQRTMADLKKVYQAISEEEAMDNLILFKDKWGKTYFSCVKSWEENWDILSTFFAYPPEVRKIIYTTNIIEGLNRQFRQITKNKPSFSNDDSLRKMLYLASQKIVERWTQRCRNWDVVLSQLSIIFEDRIPA